MSKMPDKDEITKKLSKALDIITLKYPQRTAFGVLLGFVLMVLMHTARFALIAKGIFIDWMHYVFCEVLGVLAMNSKSLYEAFNGTALDERVGNLMNHIDTRTDLSKHQKELLILEILRKEIDSLSDQQVGQVGKNVVDK